MSAPRLEWERVESDTQAPAVGGLIVQRARVPGGWLVAYVGHGLAFVPDAAAAWTAPKAVAT